MDGQVDTLSAGTDVALVVYRKIAVIPEYKYYPHGSERIPSNPVKINSTGSASVHDKDNDAGHIPSGEGQRHIKSYRHRVGGGDGGVDRVGKSNVQRLTSESTPPPAVPLDSGFVTSFTAEASSTTRTSTSPSLRSSMNSQTSYNSFRPTVVTDIQVLLITHRARPTKDGYDWSPPCVGTLEEESSAHAAMRAIRCCGLEDKDIIPMPRKVRLSGAAFGTKKISLAKRKYASPRRRSSKAVVYFAALKRSKRIRPVRMTTPRALGCKWFSLKDARDVSHKDLLPLFSDSNFSEDIPFTSPASDESDFDLLPSHEVAITHDVPWDSDF